MDVESQSKPTDAVEKAATPSWTVFNAGISSRIKQAMQRKKKGAKTKAGPPQLETIVEDKKPTPKSITPEGLLRAIQAASSPPRSRSASTSASTSGSDESSPPPKAVSSRKGTSLFNRMMPSRKRKPVKPAKVQSRVEYILFDDDGNPAWTCLRAREALEMGTDSDTENEKEETELE